MMKKESKYIIGWLSVIFLLLFFSLPGQAQEYIKKKVNVEYSHATMKDILTDLTRKTGIEFLYNQDEVKQVKPQTFTMKQVSVKDVLDYCFKGTSLGYKFTEGMIVITANKVAPNANLIKITGKVTDEGKEALAGATVMVKGTTVGVATDMDGKYEINIAHVDSLVLVVSFLGMKSQEVKFVPGKTVYNVRLEPDHVQIEDVVVTGYGSIRKTSFTGNAKTVKGEDLLKVSRTNVLKALSTFDPSFRITEDNIWGSDPNKMPEITIRGRSSIGTLDLDKDKYSKNSLEKNPNTPTFILDGFEVDIQKVVDLDPSRIESMTILKDAAATAIYGSRAANGVVVITTIPPRAGQLRVTYNVTATVEAPDLTAYNLMNSKEKLKAEELAGLFDPKPGVEYEGYADYLRKYNAVYVEGVETDWMSLPLRTAFKHKHSLNIEGGSKGILYSFDLHYTGDNGVMKGSSRETAGAGMTLNFNFKKLNIRNAFSYSRTLGTESPYGSFSDYVHKMPYSKYKDANGDLLPQLRLWKSGGSTINPMYEATLYNFDKDKYEEILNNLQLRWSITDYLLAQGSLGISKRWDEGDRFIDPRSMYSTNQLTTTNLLAGDLYTDRGNSSNLNGKVALSYNRTIGKHNINFSLNGEISESTSNNLSTHYIGFPSGKFSSVNYASEVKGKPQKSDSKSRTLGAAGVLNYSISEIYLSDFSCRYDGSSMFGTKQKGAWYWSGGLGLNIHNYSWMENLSAYYINRLKIRASYGQLGNVKFPAYAAQDYYNNIFEDWYITGYGTHMAYMGNPHLKGEKTHMFDVGFDLAMFNGRLNLIGTYYNKTTVDLINDVTIPSSSGFTVYKDNLGKVRNRGFELELFVALVQKKEVALSIFGNFACNKNKMLKIAQSLKDYNERVNEFYSDYRETSESDSKYAQVFTKYEEGVSMTAQYGMQSLGIDPATGKEVFRNRDGSITYEWNAREMVNMGDSEAKGSGAFGFNARYKNLTLTATLQYEFGGYRYNETLRSNVENADIAGENVDKRVLTDRWQKPGDKVALKDIADRDLTTRPTTRFMQEYNTLSLTSLTLQYELPREVSRKFGVERLRVEGNCGELFRLSSVKQERGLSYPFARNFNFTLMVNF